VPRTYSVPVKRGLYSRVDWREEHKSKSNQDLLKAPMLGKPISVWSFGRLTDSKPLKLISFNLSCTVRITDTHFELFYDDGDSVVPNRNRTKTKTQQRSPKVWISGLVSKNAEAFTLEPTKLLVSICGVEHGLRQSTGGPLCVDGPRLDVNTASGALDHEHSFNSNTSISTNISSGTLTKSWFATEGFILDSTDDEAKRFLEDFFPLPKEIVNLIWQYLPESNFKDWAQICTVSKERDQVQLKNDETVFKPFTVIPLSPTELTISEIDLEAYVYNNLDAPSNSFNLSKLNGSFISLKPQSGSDEIYSSVTSESLSNSYKRYNIGAYGKDESTNLNYLARQTLAKCVSTPAPETHMSTQVLVKSHSNPLDVVQEEYCFIEPLISDSQIDQELAASQHKKRKDTSDLLADESLDSRELVAPELSHLYSSKTFDNGQDVDYSLTVGDRIQQFSRLNIGVTSDTKLT